MKKKYLIVIPLVLITFFILISIGISYSLFNYQLKGKTKNKIVTGIYSSCEYENGTEWTFDYTGSEQTFTVPCDGEYKVELWGASGKISSKTLANSVGLGAYTFGKIKFLSQKKISVYVGGDNGYNGGGSAEANGGGATDIRLESNNLNSRIMVAGAGGGGMYKDYTTCISRGDAGGLNGYDANASISVSGVIGTYHQNGYSGHGATQTNGGKTGEYGYDSYVISMDGSFGQGGYITNRSSSGGGGYYGGGHGRHPGSTWSGGGGGSSFISGHDGCDAISINSTEGNIIHTGQPNHYSGYIFTETKMVDGAGYNWTSEKGEYVGMPSHDGASTMTGNSGNGYAKITLVESRDRYKETILNGTDPVLEGSLVPVQISDDGTVTKADINNEWYNYGEKRWANAIILKDESVTYKNGEEIPETNIESYFVWIPRYKYKIFDEGSYTGLTSISSKEQVIEVVFENKETTPSNGTTVGDYLTHPAFTSFNSNGMWVGKFETGYDGATSTTAAQVNSVATDKIIIKPNVYSWRNITVGKIFKNSYDYLRNLDSHMMKNTEWGAVAYLQHSAYGSATSVRINNNSAYITGYSAKVEPTLGYNNGTSIEGNRVESTSIGVDGTYTVNYLNSSSKISSTTGNYTGVYDMSGGAWEYVMGYTTKASTTGGSSGITDLYADFFNDATYTKYWDKYTSTSSTNYNNRILGDATGEMGPFGSQKDPDGNTRYKSSWYKDFATFANASNPWFDRGGVWYHGTSAGVSAFFDYTGGAYTNVGYRIVLTPNN